MPLTMTNRGLAVFANTAWASGSTTPDIRQMAFKGTVPAVATIRDWNSVQDALDSTLDEAAASGYSRQDLTITVAESDASDNYTITAPAPVLTSVASGETWTAVGYFVHNAGADSTKDLIAVDVPTPSTLVTNGQNVTMPALSLTVTGS